MRFLENFAALRAFQNFTGLVSLKSVRDHHSILCMISYEILKTHSFQKEQKFVKLQFEPSDLFYLVITLFPVWYAPKSMFQAGLFNLVNIRLFSS